MSNISILAYVYVIDEAIRGGGVGLSGRQLTPAGSVTSQFSSPAHCELGQLVMLDSEPLHWTLVSQ